MTEPSRSKASIPRSLILAGLLIAGAAWTATAIFYQAPPPWRWIWIAGAGFSALAILMIGPRRPVMGLVLTLAAVLVVGLWWTSIRPQGYRVWAPDVARGVTAEIQGSKVIVHNVRDSDWRTRTDASERWETRAYDMDDLVSVDLVSSVWANPAIAHTLIRFDFSKGEPLVFSAEIRREKHEAFSEIAGFFKAFELVVVAADQTDIIRLRKDVRGETVSQYRLLITPDQARGLLLSYLEAGNALDRNPRFYNTLTTNCTTVIFELARMVEPGIPGDWRVLVSGYLADYLYDHGVIRTDLPVAEVKRQAIISPITHPSM